MLTTFNRLNLASKNYSGNDVFQTACLMTKNYVKIGMVTGVITLIVSFCILAVTSVRVYKANIQSRYTKII